ncbi:MAG: hypothetical protein KDC49_16160 [Saprospiraceae bacterium]|nr:hypothetical protein [Saprospiraceae bacterium]
MKRPLKIALLFLICHSLNGQSINDVLSALPICGLGNYDISLPKSEFSDLGDFNCFPDDASFEHYEMLKIHGIIKGGTLSFDFIPVDANDDIDFIVYKLDGTNASPIRCMASGKSLDLQGAECSGPTGLAEFATDLIEYEGCEEGSDNYLRHLDVEVGEEYLILVTNYKSGNPCAFHLYGTAKFGQAELQLSDSLTFCKDYIFSYKVDKLPGYQYEWSIGSATSDSFELLGNLLTNKYVVNTSSIGAFKYKLKYYNPNGTCAPTYTNVSNIKIEECKECSDGIKNFDETDLDCGGPKCPQCSGCDIITDLDLQDITVNCEGDYYDTIPLIGNYCNVYYDGIFNLEISEEPCKKTIIKSWTFELPDTNIVLYQRTIVDKTPKIINESLISDIHIQCKADLPIVPELYYIDPCIGDTIKPFYDSKELYDGNGDLIERRFWKFESRCSEDFILSQDILIKYTQGISYPKSPEDISLSCEISTPNREEFKVIVDCETILDPVFSEVTTTTSCSTIINRKYHFYLDGIVDTTFEHNIFKIDTIAPVPTSIPPVELRFLCANDTVTVPLFFANDNCDGEVYPVFMMENDGGLGTKESPLWIYKSWEFSDACGNTTVLNQNIKIQNDEQILLPEGPPDLSFECLDAVPEPANLIATAGCGQFVNGILTETRQGNSCHMTILRRWTFKHLDLEEKVLEQRITVDNYRLPQFIVPPDTIIECINNYEEQLYGSPTEIATACGISSDVSYTNTFTDDKACPGSGVILRTWKVKDLCGNEKVAVQKIEMQDHTAPVPIQSFPDIIIACKQEIPEIQDAQAIDYCTGEKISSIISEENNGGAATPDDHLLIKRKRVYKDACGNEFETIQNIRVTGSTEVIYPDPPGTYTVYCVGDVRPAETLVATNGCDNRSVGVVTETTEGDSCYLKVIRTWTFSFKGLDDKSITQTIYVKNQEIPEFSVPENITIACDANAIPDFTGVPSNINTYCNIGTTINYIDENKTEVCVGTGFWKRSWIATDACGNVRQKYQTIFFEDKTPPNLPPTPDDQEAACGKTPLLKLTAQDNCSGEVVGIMTSEVSNGGGGYWGNPEVFTRTYEFTDDCGNKDFVYEKVSIIGTDVVNVEDAPKDDVISCIDDLITPGILRAVNSCGQEIIAIPVRNDNGNLSCSGTVTFTWTFEFPGLDPIVRQQTVTIENNSVPDFDVPAGKLISCEDSDAPSNTGNPSNLTTYCGELPEVSYSDVIRDGSCVNSYDITRTWRAKDRCNNVVEYDQILEVRDIQNPLVKVIPIDETVSCLEAVQLPNVNAVTATDNCGGSIFITVKADEISNETCPNRYTITRTYVARDACGNVSEADQTITVNDFTGPIITSIPQNLTVSCSGEVPQPNTLLVQARDNCGSAPIITFEADVISNRICENRYTITRRYVATDACNNQSFADQTIRVFDDRSPVIGADLPILSLDCDQNLPPQIPLSSLNVTDCSSISSSTMYDQILGGEGNPSSPQIRNRVYTVTDVCGNSSSKTQHMELIDNNPGYVIGGDGVECPGNERSLTAFGGSTFFWYNSGSNNQNITVNPNSTTTYIVAITNENGCTTYAGKEVRVHTTGDISLDYNQYSVTAFAEGASNYQYNMFVSGNYYSSTGATLNFLPNMTDGNLEVSASTCIIGNLPVFVPSPQYPNPPCSSPVQFINQYSLQYNDNLPNNVYYLTCGAPNDSFKRDGEISDRAGSTPINGAEVSCSGCSDFSITWNVNNSNVQYNGGCYLIANPGQTISGSVTICRNSNSSCCTTINF